MMKNVLLFFLALVIGISGYWFSIQYVQSTIKTPSTLPRSIPTEIISYSIKNPPSEALMGTMSSLIGEIQIETRDATEPAKLKNAQSVMQGERVLSAEKGSVRITYGIDTTILLDNDTDVSFTQTLPISIVITQNKGTVTYSQNTDTFPLSVRVRNLLVRLVSGSVTISLEDSDPLIRVVVHGGSVKIAYNNNSFESQVNTLSKGDTMIFDSDARNATIE
ncbi:MAG: hypothetical protein NUV65_05695 [Candidatus Roizmanbacteria bacterium]|nr:hypothetical protein [Candidatus Roizmanbacteria bacterium]